MKAVTWQGKQKMIDVLFQCLDALEEYKNNIQETSDEGTNDNENLIKALNDILNDGKTEEAPAPRKRLPLPQHLQLNPAQTVVKNGMTLLLMTARSV